MAASGNVGPNLGRGRLILVRHPAAEEECVDRQEEVRRVESWVIYRLVIDGTVTDPAGVCAQDEWEAMEREQPGGTFVVQSGIADEGVAERLARGTSDGPVLRVWRDNRG
jgi:hypothetical protein